MQVLINVEVDKELINVEFMGTRDIDSNHFYIYYDKQLIGHGHYNHKTEWAHVTLDNENQELEDYLVKRIER